MRFPISISLKVVRLAAVFWAFFKFLEMALRIPVIGTLVSVRDPWISVGAFFAVAPFLGAAAALGGAATGVGGGLAGSATYLGVSAWSKI